ncbi:methylenetetrahydrofolate reductase [NAD(P)H] [Gudongella oleilytica]|uniref:methylenetetrahydrofolate reductase [NAD(P)H] n=1 Tax=Gudongella oleilytica TaxID=1582259 RepID=UPI002A36A6A9|nr:methylenetetrahydrofolate reductase [NAD(P)H] [Gudongella oleilytica]MDY0257631.1 methylenetetrahydrofolate reductase [NAD(P)H] [Gudongella oleilytica]
MRIRNLFDEREVVYSFEIFPPKPDFPIDTIYSTIEELSGLKADYISVTYGAGGSTTSNRTAEIASIIKNNYGIEALAHLTCVGSNEEKIDSILNDLRCKNIDNILALRGDILGDVGSLGIFKNSQDIISYSKKNGNFGIAAACYPEGHIESKDKSKDIDVLKLKEECGADYFVTQLFFDNNLFYDFLNKVEQKGIKSPIQAGIMPVINKKQIERITSLCGAQLPHKFIKIINKYEHDKDALRDAGIAYALDQIVDLISSGVRGIHLYTMNNPYIAKTITDGIDSILNSINRKKVV